MNWWAIIIIAFAVGLLPWQIFRFARHRNDVRVTKSSKVTKSDDDDDASSW